MTKKPVIFGDGGVTRDFFHVHDTARALTELLNVQFLNGETINIGTGVEIRVQDVVEKILELMGRKSLGIHF